MKDSISNIGDNRTSLIKKNIVCSFVIKGWSALIAFLIVPITLKCLGEYSNGVWLTISSLLLWIDHLDIGLGNGLRNKLASSLAHNDISKAKEMVSSTFFMLIIIIIPVILLLVSTIYFCDIYAFLGIKDHTLVPDLKPAIAITLLLIGCNFVFKFIGNFYMGLQLPAVNNFLLTTGHTLALIATYIAYYTGHTSLVSIAVINTCSPLIVYLVTFPYTFWYRYPQLCPSLFSFKFSAIKEILFLSVKFFLLQISGVILFLTSNILISRYLSPSMVTPYQFAYKYLSVVILLFTIINVPFWTATTDAYERKDFEWIKKSQKRMNLLLGGLTLLTLILISISQIFYHFWVGDEVYISTTLTALIGCYIMILVTSMNFSNFLNGIGALSLQLICTISAAVLFIPLTYAAIHISRNIYSIIIVMIIVNIPGLIINKIQFHKILNGTAKGIWAK